MFPKMHDLYYANRLSLKGEMPWEPWVHCATWISMFLVLWGGEEGDIPPINGTDWIWLAFGLVSPPVGFASVWLLEYHKGRARYVALWLRMLADFGVVLTIFFYQLDRWANHGHFEVFGLSHSVLANVVLNFTMFFMLVLVKRDAQFILETEKLAAEIWVLTEAAHKVDDERG
jgi:hypothetical protein